MTVTQAEFARMAGTSRPAICSKVKNKTLIIDSGGMLDTDNPVNRNYLNKHQAKQQREASAELLFASGDDAAGSKVNEVSEKKIFLNDASSPVVESSENPAKDMLNMTLREIVKRYPSWDGVERYVKLLKDLTTADEKQQRLEERRQLQIPKDFVVSRLFGFINQLTNKILDVPESLADQVIALVQSDPENCRQKIVNYSRDVLSRAIGGAKETVINELNSLKNKYDDDETIMDKLEEMQDGMK